MSSRPPLIFFDGVCQLCNSFVDFILKVDQREVFQLASLQGETAKLLLPHEESTDMRSVILLKDERIYRESAAVIEISKSLPWPWKAGTALIVIPPFLRDPAYRWVARHRYQIFGKRSTCRLPLPHEAKRLLS